MTASFTVHVVGTNEDANNMRARLSEIGVALGYGARRGPNPGRGAVGLLIRDLADGNATLLPAGEPGDFAWLAGVFESLIAEHPERAEVLRSGIAACEVATKLKVRGPVGGKDCGGRLSLAEE